MLDTIIISGFVGFLLGGIVVAVAVYKTFSEAWDNAWNKGYQYGTKRNGMQSEPLWNC